MSQTLVLKAAGLYTHPSNLSAVPDGALTVADNITIDREGLLRPRRGFDRLSYAYSDSSYRANQIHVYQSVMLSHYSTNLLAYYDNSTGWNNFSGTYSPVDANNRVRFVTANQNLFFTTSTGVKKIDVYNGTVRSAGAYQALTITGNTSGGSGFLADGYKVAYRSLWYYKDANNNYIYGAPSERVVVTNSAGGTRDVSLTITVPTELAAESGRTWYYQVYRSAQYDATADAEPNDELGLIYEAAYTSGTTVSVTDSTSDDLRGATIYTASSQEGIANANTPPPLAKDIAVFKGSMFYANTKSRHRLYLTVLAVGGTNGVQTNDTVTIAGTVYTAKASETVASGYFAAVTSGSASQNITDTAKSLVKVINQYTSNTSVYAYYISGPDDLPGKILIEERSVGGSTFYAIGSRAASWSPRLPTSGTTVASSNDTYKHAVYFSKYQQPEAVPLANYFLIGQADKEIIRIIPLRDSLFVLKEDGVFRIMGEAGSFRVDPFDSTTRIRGPETAATLNNQIYCLTDQGVVTITDTGVSVVSRPIETTLLEVFGASLANVRAYSYGVGYETERKYILSTITTSGDTYATQQFVFNTFTNSWTRWTLPMVCGYVSPVDDKLYYGQGNSAYVMKEFKTYSFTDYVDFGLTATVSAYDSGTRTLTITNSDEIDIGDVIYQSSSEFALVESVDTINGTVTIELDTPFTAGSVTVYSAIDCRMTWAPVTGGNPGVLKHFREATLMFNTDFTLEADVVFQSELSGGGDTVTLTGVGTGVWGLFAWGDTPWGGSQRARPIRTYVPQSKQRCSQLVVSFNHKVGYSQFELAGLSIVFGAGSEKVMR